MTKPVLVVLLLSLLAGCSTSAPLPEPTQVDIHMPTRKIDAVPDRLDAGALVALVEEHNPGLRALAAEVDATEERLRQAGLLPNPEVGLRQSDVPLSQRGEGGGVLRGA